MLWNLFLAIVGVQWVCPLLVRATLLSCHGSFVGKKMLKVWIAAPFCFDPFGVREIGLLLMMSAARFID